MHIVAHCQQSILATFDNLTISGPQGDLLLKNHLYPGQYACM